MRGCPKWDARKPIDLTGDVPSESNQELFDDDARPRPSGKSHARKKQKSDTTTSTGGSASINLEAMSSEIRLRWEAAQAAYKAAKEKDQTIMRLEEFKFLGINTKEMDPAVAYWINLEK